MDNCQSPLMLPVKWQDNKIFVLDETLLPFTEKYLQVASLEDALFCLKEMKTRAFGQVLLYFYTCLLLEHEYQNVEILTSLVAKKFKNARPTFDFFYLAGMLQNFVKQHKISIEQAIIGFIKKFEAFRRRRCGLLAEVLPQKANILTICNINGELIYLHQAMRSRNKTCVFYVTETRPYLQGSRLTFWELQKCGIEPYLLCDAQAAIIMQQKKVNVVLSGADRANTNGDIINKIGTYALFSLAKHFKIPSFAFIQYPHDFDINKVEIEERPPQEVFMYTGLSSEYPDAVYPAFDIVPKKFIRGLSAQELVINDNFYESS